MAARAHQIDPDLLGPVEITRPNQVGSADLTYVPMSQGFMDLGASLDWGRRSGLAGELSNTLATGFGLETLARARKDGCPKMFNTAPGVQFTSRALTTRVARAGIAIRMDGRGRALDNIVVEQFWRAVT